MPQWVVMGILIHSLVLRLSMGREIGVHVYVCRGGEEEWRGVVLCILQ